MNITIITPVWNNATTIAHCLHSIVDQTEDCQHILVDGGSTDDTLDTIDQCPPSNRVIVSEPDQGMYDAINKGLKLATGDVVGVLNSDDFYATNNVFEKVKLAFSDENVDACYGDLRYVGKDDIQKVVRNWHSGEYNAKRFYNGWMPPHPTFFLKRRCYETHGGYRLDLGSAADYELMLRMLLKQGCTANYIPEVLVHMRNDGMSNSSLKNRISANRHDRKAWKVNGTRPYPWTLIAKPLRKLVQWL
jgi:glycosyltransferase involved in cell wall biosynthesis